MSEYYSQYAKAYVSVDCIVFGFDDNKLKFLAGRRKLHPGYGEWALYGGFVGTDESVDDAASRVLHELTGLKDIYMKQVGTFGALDRAEGERVISVAYVALINVKDYDEKNLLEKELHWVSLENIPKMFSDHNKMVNSAVRMLRRRIHTEPISFQLLPKYFTLTQLQNVHEAVLNTVLDKRNFRKKVKQLSYVIKTDKMDKLTSKRGAALYRFDETAIID